MVGKSDNTEEELFDTEQYNKELDEADAAIERGEYHTHEEVMNMVKELLSRPK